MNQCPYGMLYLEVDDQAVEPVPWPLNEVFICISLITRTMHRFLISVLSLQKNALFSAEQLGTAFDIHPVGCGPQINFE